MPLLGRKMRTIARKDTTMESDLTCIKTGEHDTGLYLMTSTLLEIEVQIYLHILLIELRQDPFLAR